MTSGLENLLTQALKNLNAEWQQTRPHWRDAQAAAFAERFLDPLPQHVVRAARALVEVQAKLRSIHEDCA